MPFSRGYLYLYDRSWIAVVARLSNLTERSASDPRFIMVQPEGKFRMIPSYLCLCLHRTTVDADDGMMPGLPWPLPGRQHVDSMKPKRARDEMWSSLLDESDKHDKLDHLLSMSRRVIRKIHGIGRHDRHTSSKGLNCRSTSVYHDSISLFLGPA